METGSTEEEVLYLTTTGRRSGLPRDIEIWFTRLDGRSDVIAEHGHRAHWVQNALANPHVRVRVGTPSFAATARVVDAAADPGLTEAVRTPSREKYGWGDGLVVELQPT